MIHCTWKCCGSNGISWRLLRRDPQDVILYLDFASRKLRLNPLLQLLHCGRAVLAVEAASVIHQDYVRVARIFQDGFKFAGEALLVALESGPAVVAGVQPEQRRFPQRPQQLGHYTLAVALENMYVRRSGTYF